MWVNEFQKVNPNVRFKIEKTSSGQGLENVLQNKTDLGMISSEIPIEYDTVLWTAPIARLAVVPIISKKNPYLAKIQEIGLSKDDLLKIFTNSSEKFWGDRFGSTGKEPMNVYIHSDKSESNDIFACFLDVETFKLLGNTQVGDDNMLKTIQNDALGIGFCNMVYLLNPSTGDFVNDVEVLTFDFNSNGKIDEKEVCSKTYNNLQRAIWLGRFPHALTRELYLASNGKPQKAIVIEFLKWVLTDGQRFVNQQGYIEQHHGVVADKANELSQ